MSGDPGYLDDWAADVAERIVGDIPHGVFMRWAVEVPQQAALMLRRQLDSPSSGRELTAFVEAMVQALPDYLPEQTAARLRAKLLGALLASAALGQHFRALGLVAPKQAFETDGGPILGGKVDP
jgi:hypothetical protein